MSLLAPSMSGRAVAAVALDAIVIMGVLTVVWFGKGNIGRAMLSGNDATRVDMMLLRRGTTWGDRVGVSLVGHPNSKRERA